MDELIRQKARCFIEFGGVLAPPLNYRPLLWGIAGLLLIGDLELLVRLLQVLT